MEELPLNGFLKIKLKGEKSLTMRYFIMNGSKIDYHAKKIPPATKSKKPPKPIGSISLDQISEIREVAIKTDFNMILKDSSIIDFRAKNADEKTKWIKSLQTIIAKIQEQSLANSPLTKSLSARDVKTTSSPTSPGKKTPRIISSPPMNSSSPTSSSSSSSTSPTKMGWTSPTVLRQNPVNNSKLPSKASENFTGTHRANRLIPTRTLSQPEKSSKDSSSDKLEVIYKNISKEKENENGSSSDGEEEEEEKKSSTSDEDDSYLEKRKEMQALISRYSALGGEYGIRDSIRVRRQEERMKRIEED